MGLTGAAHLCRQFACSLALVGAEGLNRACHGRHTHRRTKATLIYRRTKNLGPGNSAYRALTANSCHQARVCFFYHEEARSNPALRESMRYLKHAVAVKGCWCR
jgi:hypothetical protein